MMANGETDDDQGLLLLAIAIGRYSAQMYRDWVHRFRAYDAGTSAILEEMVKEESTHERQLMELYAEVIGCAPPEPLSVPVEFANIARDLQSIQDHYFVVNPAMAETILEVALKIERLTRDFYVRCQDETEDRRIAEFIGRLVEFEEDHIRILLERF